MQLSSPHVRLVVGFTLATLTALSVLALATARADDRANPQPRAEADGEVNGRVVLVALSETLEQATRTALTPWQAECVAIAEPLPAQRTEAIARARALAIEHRAKVVVWLERPPAGSSDAAHLLLYDAADERLLSRPLSSPPPYDEPTAAALALTLKTMLRHSRAAPQQERSDEPPTAVEVTKLTPPPSSPSSSSPSPSSPSPSPPSVLSAPPRSIYEVAVSASARISSAASRDDAGQSATARLYLGVGWWPTFVPAGFGLRAGFDFETDQQVSGGGFTGDLDEFGAHAALIWQAWQGQRLSLIVDAGMGLRRSSLTGTVQPERAPIDGSTWLPQIEAGVTLRVPIIAPISAGVQLGTETALRTARYRLPDSLLGERASRVVAETARFSLQFGGVVIVHL